MWNFRCCNSHRYSRKALESLGFIKKALIPPATFLQRHPVCLEFVSCPNSIYNSHANKIFPSFFPRDDVYTLLSSVSMDSWECCLFRRVCSTLLWNLHSVPVELLEPLNLCSCSFGQFHAQPGHGRSLWAATRVQGHLAAPWATNKGHHCCLPLWLLDSRARERNLSIAVTKAKPHTSKEISQGSWESFYPSQDCIYLFRKWNMMPDHIAFI